MICIAVILKIEVKIERRNGRGASEALLASKTSLVVGAGGGGVIDGELPGVVQGVPDDDVS